jgi:hypothetical protein
LGVREAIVPGVDVPVTGVMEDPKFWNPPVEGVVVNWVAGDWVVTGLLLLLLIVGRIFILGGVAAA